MRVDAHSRRKPPASGRRGRGETGVEEDPNSVDGGEEGRHSPAQDERTAFTCSSVSSCTTASSARWSSAAGAAMLLIQNKRVNWDTYQIGIPGATAKDKENRRIPFNPNGRLAAILKRRATLGPEAYVFGSTHGAYQPTLQTGWETLKLLANGIELKAGAQGLKDNQEQLRRIDLRWHDLRHESSRTECVSSASTRHHAGSPRCAYSGDHSPACAGFGARRAGDAGRVRRARADSSASVIALWPRAGSGQTMIFQGGARAGRPIRMAHIAR